MSQSKTNSYVSSAGKLYVASVDVVPIRRCDTQRPFTTIGESARIVRS